MTDWWNGLDFLMKVLYCIAVPSSLLLLIQTVMSLMGFGDNGAGLEVSDTSGLDLDSGADMTEFDDIQDLPASHDGSNPLDYSTLRLFTVQGLVAFFTVFSWTSIISINSGTYELLGIVIGAILGFAVMVLIAKLIQMSRKLTENGTLDIRNSIGEIGTVYIPIPAASQGHGKVVLKVQNRFAEFDAVTTAEAALASNTQVRVTDVRGDLLVVEADI